MEKETVLGVPPPLVINRRSQNPDYATYEGGAHQFCYNLEYFLREALIASLQPITTQRPSVRPSVSVRPDLFWPILGLFPSAGKIEIRIGAQKRV